MGVWIEISLIEHWGPRPHGIPRVSQNLFLQGLGYDDIRFFYFHRVSGDFIATENTKIFADIAVGKEQYADDKLPSGVLLTAELQSGDRILFTEAGWDHACYVESLLNLRGSHPGVAFQCLVYDLIAIRFPQFFEAEFGERVRDYLWSLPRFCDRYLCISESTAKDVRELLSSTADVRVLRLGSDIAAGFADEVPVTGLEGSYVLAVGTIEIRKNHLLLYYVWRRLSSTLGDKCPRLVLVGRKGWIAGDVYTLFRTDPAVSDLVEIRHDVSNQELVALYRNSLFTVFPSFYEGWGLPASESLYFGKVCVTSNTSSIPEINPFPELMFDPYDHQEAFRIIRSLIESPDSRKRYEAIIAGKHRVQTWRQFFADLQHEMG